MKKIKIIGAGISGVALANVLANNGWKVDIYEKKPYVGGNCYDLRNNNILIHKFGPHIFHTDKKEIYDFISKFCSLNGYVNKVFVKTNSKTFPLPINFKSIRKICGVKANKIIHILKTKFPGKKTITLFDAQKINDVNVKDFIKWIGNNVYFNYSQKMWGVKFSQIDPKTINRVKIVLGTEHNYFPDDRYQGLPKDGYTKMIQKMLSHRNIKLHLNYDALKHIELKKQLFWDKEKCGTPIVYCGPLDEVFKFKYGMLPYRSLDIHFKLFNKTHFQKSGVVNYPSHPKMTRIAEYKYLTKQKIFGKTIISEEYPGEFKPKSKKFNVRYYPIINNKNLNLYKKYFLLAKKYKNFYPLGRLAQYKYFDMDDAIENALLLAKRLLNA